MKKLILLFILWTNFVHAQTVDFYSLRTVPRNSIKVSYINVSNPTPDCKYQEWNLSLGIHRVLRMSSACAVLGSNDLRLDTNSTIGYRVDPCGSYQMLLPKYLEFAVENYYTGEEITNYKESFAIAGGSNHFPYRYNSSHQLVITDQIEFDSLVRYGTPDTSLASVNVNPVLTNVPYTMGVTHGWGESYGYGYYNQGNGIDSLPDGYYIVGPEFYVRNAGNRYPTETKFIIQLIGDSVVVDAVPPVIAPSAITSISAWQGKGNSDCLVQWSKTQMTKEYIVQPVIYSPSTGQSRNLNTTTQTSTSFVFTRRSARSARQSFYPDGVFYFNVTPSNRSADGTTVISNQIDIK